MPPQFGKKNDLFGQILILFGQLSSGLKFIRGANLLRFDYVCFPFFFWLSRKNCRAVGKNYSGGKIFRAYYRVPSQKFVSPYAYGHH